MRTGPNHRVLWRLALLLAVAGLSRAGVAAAPWVRVETPNFVLIGEPSEKRVRDVAEQFERFREALGRVLPGSVTTAAVPTVVVVFSTQRSFEPYRPRFNGKPVELGGYFVSTSEQNLVALTIENRDRALRTVFHEYAHLVVANVSRELPAWINEGLAEYYSTFAVQDDGRTAIVGSPIPEHLLRLNQERLIPHTELLKVDRTSSLYNEGERRSVFYAQSWALVHMLLLGEPDRSKDLARYLALAGSGVPADEAWHSVFGAMDVNVTLQRYVAQLAMRALRFRFEQEIPRVRGAASTPSEADVQATLGDLLRHVQLRDEGAARLEKAAGMTPSSARAAGLLGLLRLDQSRDEEAERLLLTAAADKTDWLAQYHAAVGLTARLHQVEGDVSRLAGAAREAVTAVLGARPDLPHALALGARISAKTGTRLDEALTDIRRARALAPGREDYAFDEARVLLERREFAQARTVLGPLLTPRYHTSVRELARTHMAQIVRVESSYREAQDWPRARADADGPDRDEPASGETWLQPVFRKLLDGEQRSQGLLERIECSRQAQAIVLHVRVGEAVERFAAPRFEAIDFITYREDPPGAIRCTARTPPDPVYLTWRPAVAPATLPIAIAVEFLPKRGT